MFLVRKKFLTRGPTTNQALSYKPLIIKYKISSLKFKQSNKGIGIS